ncbi:MAG: hypothetical protein AB8H79_23625 [Myxococcota bacterium]
MLPSQITLIELVVEDAEPIDDTVLLVVTATVHLRVPAEVDPDLVAVIVDAICEC